MERPPRVTVGQERQGLGGFGPGSAVGITALRFYHTHQWLCPMIYPTCLTGLSRTIGS
jgi:hypothetical protein